MSHDLQPFAVQYRTNPSLAELRELALAHTPALFETALGSLVKVSRNKARQARFTYVIAERSTASQYSQQLIDPARAQALIDRQRAYIESKGELIDVRGYLGLGPRAVPVQWLYTVEGANIAGMQRVLSFPPEAVLEDGAPFEAAMQVIYTPDLFLDDMPGRQAILVDLERYRTYIMGPDYFGESKKAALRMLNHLVFQQGGLVLHAGAKLVEVGDAAMTMTVMGLSGTGKTTTTFSKQGEVTRPIQDDMVAIWPGGELSITENGCFAKTFGLTADSEPVIHRGTCSADAWLENVYIDENGQPDFFKARLSPDEVARMRDVLVLTGADPDHIDRFVSGEVAFEDVVDENGVPLDGWDFVVWTANGRSILPMSSVEDAADLTAIPEVHSMGILNRDEGYDAATPGLVRFTSPAQAAGYFMLGETSKTSAAGKDRGKTRSPFTQPFFPLAFGLQAERFSALAATMPDVGMWLMNTGYVGGDARSVAGGEGLKVKIRHSSAMLEALLQGAVVWKRDPDFGYDVVDVDAPENAALIQAVPMAILDPRRHYAETGRADVYGDWVRRMKVERAEFLGRYAVDSSIIAAVCGT
jgi:phosphoenolpyruvate carboxykinase (ATP)